MKYINRNIESKLQGMIAAADPYKDVLLVEGARQVGKTTLIDHLLKSETAKKIIINLERDRLFRMKIDECREFSEFEELLRLSFGFDPAEKTILFIDESQESLQLGQFVRFMKESWHRTTTVLSGSTLSRLFRKNTRYPVGRVRKITVSPFSFSEFLRAKKNDFLTEKVRVAARVSPVVHQSLLQELEHYLAVGGLPRVVLDHTQGKDFRERRKAIISDYEEDFIRLFGEEDLAVVKACFRSVANYVGAPSKNSSVVPSPTASVHHKINSIFSRLEQWKLILRSEQRGISPEQSHRYLPKRYLFDTGILRHYREAAVPAISLLDTVAPELRKPLGGIIENQVAIELSRKTSDLNGWKKSPSGMEIDFILPVSGTLMPIECKAATRIKKTHLKGVAAYLRQYRLKQGLVISLAPHERFTLPGDIEVVNIPLYMAETISSVD